MKNIWSVLKSFFYVVYFLGVFYLALMVDEISYSLHLPRIFLPVMIFAAVLILTYKYIKMALKVSIFEDEFIQIVNHTFRTPLTRINWLTKELEKDMPQKDRLLYLQDLENASTRLLDIVDLFAGIKNINDTSGYFFEATSVRMMVEQSIEKYRSEIIKKNLNFSVATFKDVPMLTVDLKKISFVIDTLVENAVYYTPKGGKIIVEVESSKRSIRLFVADTGIGLNIFDRNKLFSKFFRNKKSVLMNPNGMGLRLYLAKQIVRRHKGQLYAKSKGRNKGTTFVLELPFQK